MQLLQWPVWSILRCRGGLGCLRQINTGHSTPPTSSKHKTKAYIETPTRYILQCLQNQLCNSSSTKLFGNTRELYKEGLRVIGFAHWGEHSVQNKALTLVARTSLQNKTLTSHFHNSTGHFQHNCKDRLEFVRTEWPITIEFVRPQINNGREMASGHQ